MHLWPIFYFNLFVETVWQDPIQRWQKCKPNARKFLAAFKGCALHSIIHTRPRTNQESSNEALPLTGSVVIKLLKANSKELETESLLGHEPYLYDTEDENSDAVLPDELPDVTGLDREIVYYLAGFTTFRKKFRLKLCSDCQQVFFVSKEMREFCTPADSDLT